MSKTVKTIAKVAAVAAAAYYGGGYIANALGENAALATAEAGITTAQTGIAATPTFAQTLSAGAKGLLESKAVSIGGMAMQGMSTAQQMVAAGEERDLEKKAAEDEAAMRDHLAQQERIKTIRENNILAGRMEARAANTGTSQSGTSSIVTGLGSLNTQTNVALADIQGKTEAANTLGATRSAQYTAMNSAQGWQSFGALGSNIFTKSDSLSNSLKNIFA